MSNAQIGREQLRAFIERIERLEEEKKAIQDDIKEVYAEAKATGFETKVMRQIVRIRKQDASERAEQEAILDLYLHALGMIVGGEFGGEDAPATDVREPIRAARRDGDRHARNAVGIDVGEGA